MKHIESSAKIITQHPIEASAVKYSLVQRLRSTFHVETVGDGSDAFSVAAMGKSTSYVFSLNIQIKCEPNRIRVLVDGENEVSMATKIFYVVSLLLVLAFSLFPSGAEEGGPGMMLVAIFFLVSGGFIIYDMNKKFEEPQHLLDRVMTSLEAEYG